MRQVSMFLSVDPDIVDHLQGINTASKTVELSMTASIQTDGLSLVSL